MKQTVLILMLSGLTLIACTRSDAVIAPTPTSLDGTWRMILVKENGSGLTTTKPASIKGDVDIIFTSVSPTNGTFIGNTPTNDIWQSNYAVDLRQSISIPCLSMTKVMETSWGNEFVNNILSAQSYNFQADGRLNIKTENKILTFKKM